MRFKTFLYHFLLVTAIIILMGTGGYFSLKQILHDQLESRVRSQAGFLTLILDNPDNSHRQEELVNTYGLFDSGAAWIIDPQGDYVAFPQDKRATDPLFLERERTQVNPAMASDRAIPVFVGEGLDLRMAYSERLESGNYLVVVMKADHIEGILSKYSRFTLWGGVGLLFASFYILIFLSGETLKPLFALQEYARNLAVGEYIDRPDSLVESDVVSIATVLERYYIWTRREDTPDSNPMSGLPGNKSLYDALFRLIEEGRDMAVAFVDANDFTAYNNKYGSARGDSVIRFMGVTLLNAISEKGNEGDRIYHLGGDRFIFTTTPDKAKALCEKIIAQYDDQIAGYYDEKAREDGHIISNDRMGQSGKFPFMPLCIGVATNTRRPLKHPLQIGHIVGQIRNYLRDRQCSDYLVDRRTSDREEEYTGEMAPFPEGERMELRNLMTGVTPLEADSNNLKEPVPAPVKGQSSPEDKTTARKEDGKKTGEDGDTQ